MTHFLISDFKIQSTQSPPNHMHLFSSEQPANAATRTILQQFQAGGSRYLPETLTMKDRTQPTTTSLQEPRCSSVFDSRCCVHAPRQSGSRQSNAPDQNAHRNSFQTHERSAYAQAQISKSRYARRLLGLLALSSASSTATRQRRRRGCQYHDTYGSILRYHDPTGPKRYRCYLIS